MPALWQIGKPWPVNVGMASGHDKGSWAGRACRLKSGAKTHHAAHAVSACSRHGKTTVPTQYHSLDIFTYATVWFHSCNVLDRISCFCFYCIITWQSTDRSLRGRSHWCVLSARVKVQCRCFYKPITSFPPSKHLTHQLTSWPQFSLAVQNESVFCKLIFTPAREPSWMSFKETGVCAVAQSKVDSDPG